MRGGANLTRGAPQALYGAGRRSVLREERVQQQIERGKGRGKGVKTEGREAVGASSWMREAHAGVRRTRQRKCGSVGVEEHVERSLGKRPSVLCVERPPEEVLWRASSRSGGCGEPAGVREIV